MIEKIYISGPISNTPDYHINFRAAESIVREFLKGTPVNPVDVPAACIDYDKVNGEHWCFGTTTHRHNGHTWSCWMRGDIKALMDCQGLIMLPGWENSEGAKLEKRTANSVGMKHWILEQMGSTVMFNYRQKRSLLLAGEARRDERRARRGWLQLQTADGLPGGTYTGNDDIWGRGPGED